MKTEEQRKADYERTKKWREENQERNKEMNRKAQTKRTKDLASMRITIDYLKSLLSKNGIFYEDKIC